MTKVFLWVDKAMEKELVFDKTLDFTSAGLHI